MKKSSLLLFVTMILLSSNSVFAQLTSVSQIKDVKPTDDFYLDLQSLVERYGVAGDDFQAAADDTIPKPAKISKDDYLFFPKTALTARQFAILLNNGLNRENELIAVEDAGTGDLSKDEKERFSTKLVLLITGKSAFNKLEIRTAERAKGLKPDFDEFASMQSLIERWGIGGDFLEKNGSYNRAKTYSEKEVSDIVGNALGIKPSCVSSECSIGNVVLNCQNKTVTRARFVQIFNNYLQAFNENLQEVVDDFKNNKNKFDDAEIQNLADAVRIIKEVNNISILFKTASSDFVSGCFSNVPLQADLLKQLSKKTTLEIGVHSDNFGDEKSNVKLTQSRAEAIRNELIKYGVDANNLTAKGYGSSKPIVPNTTNDNRAKNRRVEIMIVKLK